MTLRGRRCGLCSSTTTKSIRRVARVAALGAAGATVARKLRARRAQPNAATAGASSRQVAEWPPLIVDEPAPAAAATVHGFVATSGPAVTNADDAALAPWVDPVDGQCPLTHPVKGNASSKIYHEPGSRSYNVTVPERCYRDAAAAEADGMRAPKR